MSSGKSRAIHLSPSVCGSWTTRNESPALPTTVSVSRNRRASRSAPSRTSPQRASQPAAWVGSPPCSWTDWALLAVSSASLTTPNRGSTRSVPPNAASSRCRWALARSSSLDPLAGTTIASSAASRASAMASAARRWLRTTSSVSSPPRMHPGTAKSANTPRAVTKAEGRRRRGQQRRRRAIRPPPSRPVPASTARRRRRAQHRRPAWRGRRPTSDGPRRSPCRPVRRRGATRRG